MIARDEPLFVTLTNAGSNEQGRAQVRRGVPPRQGRQRPGHVFLLADGRRRRARRHGRVEARQPVEWITIEKLLAFQKAMPPYRFERFHLNRWTRAEKAWLPRGAWDALPGRPEPKERVVLGLDMSRSRDTTALAIVSSRGGGKSRRTARCGRRGTTTKTSRPTRIMSSRAT
jgi:hypothetical protein